MGRPRIIFVSFVSFVSFVVIPHGRINSFVAALRMTNRLEPV